ncbi:AAA family ATPase [Streptomyces sp. P01-B04]|uniref:ATP-binding protein n=1 Tax=Streptomyces poriferorum TaxID=2798799 RepID=UPI001C5CEB95|nr:LuxR family transcriptional regulator [Streptomyces poriferorum]MBW5249955.1 AAA family ATPase [Streptomyces poriferorum]MBW5257150.1 AAA family ATPase [Streptomyces poriferorum]
MTVGVGPRFVGREAEVAALVGEIGDGSALVVVEGEPGIGKSRLVRHVLGEAAGRTVLWCTAPALSEPFPLGPVVDGIRRLSPDRVPDGLSPMAGALRPLFPEWARLLPPPLDPLETAGATRHRLFRALGELLDRLAVDVLVLEDAHWADTTTLELLLTLVASGGGNRSLVVTYRPAEVAEAPALLRLTSRSPAGMRLVRIALGPLSVRETGQLVGSMFDGEQVSADFAAFLRERTDGVPLAVEECVRLLADRRDVVRRGGRWIRRVLGDLEVPATVRDSVLERLTRIPGVGRRLLETAAVLGMPADAAMLAEVAGISRAEAGEGLAVALSAGLLQESGAGRFVFRHGLDAQAVGESMPVSRRRLLHARATDVWARRAPDALERLAHHSREAGELGAWCRYAEAGADVALESGDDRNAVGLLLQLLDTEVDTAPDTDAVHGPAERRRRLATKLGEAVFYGGAALGDIVDTAVEAIHRVIADPRVGKADGGELRLLLGRMLWRAGRRRAAFTEFEATVPDLGHRPDLAGITMCSLAMPVVPGWPATRHLGWLSRAEEHAARADSTHLRVAVGTARAATLLLLGDASAWASIGALHRPAHTGPRDMSVHATGLLNVAAAALPWGRYEETRGLLRAAAALIPDAEHHRVAEGSRLIEATLAWHTGAWDGLAPAMRRLADAETTEVHDALVARLLAGLVRGASEAGLENETELRTVARQLTVLGIAEPVALLPWAFLGRRALQDGDAQRALDVTAPAAEAVAAKGVWLWFADLAPLHAEALARSGRRAEAEAFVGAFTRAVEPSLAPVAAGAVHLCGAVLAEHDEDVAGAAELYRSAASVWAGIPRPYDELLALEGVGRCLLADGRRADGLGVLRDVRTRLTALGAARDGDRIARVLREQGEDVVRTWRRGRRGYGDALSPREREVLVLVARGLTNREAAEELFLSPRTVGRHLESAMRKLHVTTRTAAATTAMEAGLLATGSDSASDGTTH